MHKMPFKMHKIIFFPQKMCVPTLPQIFQTVTRNTLIFSIWPNACVISSRPVRLQCLPS